MFYNISNMSEIHHGGFIDAEAKLAADSLRLLGCQMLRNGASDESATLFFAVNARVVEPNMWKSYFDPATVEPTDPTLYVTVTKAAEILGMSRPFLLRLAKEGVFNLNMAELETRVSLLEVEGYIQERMIGVAQLAEQPDD